ncbi:MAG: ATP-binding protein [Burkholderiales bacterium]
MTTQQLGLFDELNFYEGTDVEYKAALGGLPRDLWETYAAFANTEGGILWLGITQRPTTLDVHGVDNAEKLVGDFWNTINNRSKANRNLLKNADVSIIPVEDRSGRAVVRIAVPRANRRERPVFIGTDPFRGTYRRNHEGDYVCSEDEVRRMFADQSEEPPDSRILVNFGMDDLHTDSIRQFRNRFSSREPNHPWLVEDDTGLLTKLGGWRTDRSIGISGLTIAGLLMFGRGEVIVSPEALPGFHLDYRERLSDDPAVRWTDRVTLDGTWEGNLFQFYQRVVQLLSSGPGLKAPFQRDTGGYRRLTTAVHEALQEALVNALIHADYSGQGGVVIDRFPDHFEFSNPGTLLLSREQLWRGGVSECRNKSLQRAFQMLGVGDKAGSGIDKIRSNWAEQRWRSPSIHETLRPDRVRLILSMSSLLPEAALEALRSRFGERFAELAPEDVQVLVTALQESEITNQRLQEILSLHRVDITRLLQGLVRRGYLVPQGVGRGTSYRLGDAQTGGSEAISLDKEVAPLISSPHKEVAPLISSPNTDTTPDFGALRILAEPIRSAQRASPAQVRQTLLRLCRDHFLTLKELAELLGRTAENLRDRHLAELVKTGKLELRFPAQPTHPEQGYRSMPDPSDARKN